MTYKYLCRRSKSKISRCQTAGTMCTLPGYQPVIPSVTFQFMSYFRLFILNFINIAIKFRLYHQLLPYFKL